jgi:hypothetical protein
MEVDSVNEHSDVYDKVPSRKEIEEAVGVLKNNKAVGTCGIPGEILKAGGDTMIVLLERLYASVWNKEAWPVEWCRGAILPIFKSGDELECGNYRPITLLSIVGKVLGRVVNNRLQDGVEIEEEQGGFRRGRGCIDQAFTLNELIQGHKASGKPLYTATIDVEKAYDTVWRDGLWKRLWDEGVRGKLWRMLRALYKKVESSVLVDGECSRWFVVENGVRQGCPISPILFSVFVKD